MTEVILCHFLFYVIVVKIISVRREFHLLLLEACGNRVLQVFSAALVTYFEKTTENLPQNDPQFFLDIAKNERLLLTAIKAGREDEAKALLRHQLGEQVELLQGSR